MITAIILLALSPIFYAIQFVFVFCGKYWEKSPFRLISESKEPNTFWWLWWRTIDQSYLNKYDSCDSDKGLAAYWQSKGILAWTTDAFHFFQMLYLTSWQLAILLLLDLNWWQIILGLAVFKVYYGGLFSYILNNLKANWLYYLTKKLIKND